MSLSPLQFDALADPAYLNALTTEQFGAWCRVARACWDRGGELPSAPAVLASIAGLTLSRWLEIAQDVLRVLGAEERGDVLVCRPIRDRHVAEQALALAAIEQRRQAGKASAARRRERAFNGRSTAVEQPVNERPNRGLERSGGVVDAGRRSACAPNSQSQSGAQALTPESVVAVLSDRIDIQTRQQVAAWRKERVYELLVGALRPLAGRIKRRVEVEAMHLASDPRVSPAMAEIAVNRLRIADAERGPLASPVGYLITVLGLGADAAPFEAALFDKPVIERWAALESRLFDTTRRLEAIRAAAARSTGAERAAGGGA